MPGFNVAQLASRAVLEIAGADAADFLQGLITADIERLPVKAARNSALLTPQGKILFEFIVLATGGGRFLLDTPQDMAADLAKRLTFYKLRAKVDIAERPNLAVVALWGSESKPTADAFPDPRLAALGWRLITSARDAGTILTQGEFVSEAAYQAYRIGLGVAELGQDYAGGEVFPHEADLDQLDGVDFDKGCFVGQEVVSRMQHRGTVRNRFVPVTIDGTTPARGATIEAGGKPTGIMGSSAGGRGLALLRLDRVGEALAAGEPLRCEAARLTPARPDWARFDWPGQAS